MIPHTQCESAAKGHIALCLSANHSHNRHNQLGLTFWAAQILPSCESHEVSSTARPHRTKHTEEKKTYQ